MAKVNLKMLNSLAALSAYDLTRHDNINSKTIQSVMREAGELLSGCHEYFSEYFKEMQEKTGSTSFKSTDALND